ncbi:MAG: hypothetical protein WC329_08230 [Candidatus Omnitrophota bacterium]|jgi:hypothetical protein
MRPVDWNHDQTARYARSLAYLGRERAGGWLGEVLRAAVVAVGIVAGLVIIACL